MNKKIIHEYLEQEFNHSLYCFDSEFHAIVMRALRKAEKEVDEDARKHFIRKATQWLKSNCNIDKTYISRFKKEIKL